MPHNVPSSDDVPNQNSHSLFKITNKARLKQEVDHKPPLFSEYTCSIHEPPVAFPRDVRGIQDLYYGSERAVIQARSKAATNPTNISKEDYKHFIHEIYTQVSQSQEQAERFVLSRPNRSLSTSIYEPPVFKFPPGYVRKLPTKISHSTSQKQINVSSSSLVPGHDSQQLRKANEVVQNSQLSCLQNNDRIPACERDYLSYLSDSNTSRHSLNSFPVPIKQEVISIDLDSDSELEKENLPIEIDLLSSDEDNGQDYNSAELDSSKFAAPQQQTCSESALSSQSEALSDDELSSAVYSNDSMVSSINSEANPYGLLQEEEPIETDMNLSVTQINSTTITTIHTNSSNLNDTELLSESNQYFPDASLKLRSDEEDSSCSEISLNAELDEDSDDSETTSSPLVSHPSQASSDGTESYPEEISATEQMPEHIENSEPIQTQSFALSTLLSTRASTEDLASIEFETAAPSNLELETELDDNDSVSPNEQLYVESGESLDVNVASTTLSTAAHSIATSGHGEREPSDLSVESEQLDSEASLESDQIQPSILGLELGPTLQGEKDSDSVQITSHVHIDPEPAGHEEEDQGLDQPQSSLDIESELISYDERAVVLVKAQSGSITDSASSHNNDDSANSSPEQPIMCTELKSALSSNQNLNLIQEQSTLSTDLNYNSNTKLDDNTAQAQPTLDDGLGIVSIKKEKKGLAQMQATLDDELDTAVYEKENVDLIQTPLMFNDDSDSVYGKDQNPGLTQVQLTPVTEACSHFEVEGGRVLALVEPALDTESGFSPHENEGVDLVQVRSSLDNERPLKLQEEDTSLVQSQPMVGAVSSSSNEFSRHESDGINQLSRQASESILGDNDASQLVRSKAFNALQLDFEKSENPEDSTLYSENQIPGVNMDVQFPISNRLDNSSPTNSLYSAEDHEEQGPSPSKVKFKEMNAPKSNQSKLPSVHSSDDEHSDNSDDESYYSGDDSYYSVQDETAAVPSGRRKSGVKRRRLRSYQEKIHQSRELTDLGPPPREVATPYLLRRTLPSHVVEPSPNRRLSASLGYTTSLTRANATPYMLREPAEMSHNEATVLSHEAPVSTPGTPTKPKGRRVSKRQRKW